VRLAGNVLLRINESVESVLGGLDFISPQTSPTTWAAVQVSLANTYFDIANLNGDQETLERAQAAISEALSVLGLNVAGSLTTEARALAERIYEMSEGTA
jgi:hypothetical protein